MLETRHFWFETPNEFDNAWQPILEAYSQADRWPSIPPPSREVCLSTLLHTKDSAPGPDGIPYSAWRVLPEMTLQAMSSYFYDIQEETALPPSQVGVWIPKAKMGPTADYFRPLGMPNTLDRLVDGSNAAHLMHHTAHLLRPSQTVMYTSKNHSMRLLKFKEYWMGISQHAHSLLIYPKRLRESILTGSCTSSEFGVLRGGC